MAYHIIIQTGFGFRVRDLDNQRVVRDAHNLEGRNTLDVGSIIEDTNAALCRT
jgi:hypothetical protein